MKQTNKRESYTYQEIDIKDIVTEAKTPWEDKKGSLTFNQKMEYPKQLSQEEFEEWINKYNLPLKLIITQINKDTLIFQKIKNLTNKQKMDEILFIKFKEELKNEIN